MRPLFEDPPPHIADEIRRLVPRDDEILIRVKSDLLRDGRFGEPWVVITSRRIAVICDGEESLHIPLEAVQQVRAEAGVGGGRPIFSRTNF